ncbi:MAG: hypothetical protein R2873_19315 [Caldilineaceae bacterium]
MRYDLPAHGRTQRTRRDHHQVYEQRRQWHREAGDGHQRRRIHERYAYDGHSRPYQSETTIGAQTYRSCTEYDSFSRVSKLVYPSSLYRPSLQRSQLSFPVKDDESNVVCPAVSAWTPPGRRRSRRWSSSLVTTRSYNAETGLAIQTRRDLSGDVRDLRLFLRSTSRQPDRTP